ncbi:hypothetical protein Tco_0564553 [Tanacetum coccineum]
MFHLNPAMLPLIFEPLIFEPLALNLCYDPFEMNFDMTLLLNLQFEKPSHYLFPALKSGTKLGTWPCMIALWNDSCVIFGYLVTVFGAIHVFQHLELDTSWYAFDVPQHIVILLPVGSGLYKFLVSDGCQLIMTTFSGFMLWTHSLESPNIEKSFVVREFALLFFSDELPGLPPAREIEFALSYSRAETISRLVSYGTVELKEFKGAVTGVLENGLIDPVFSHGVCTVLLLRRRMGACACVLIYSRTHPRFLGKLYLADGIIIDHQRLTAITMARPYGDGRLGNGSHNVTGHIREKDKDGRYKFTPYLSNQRASGLLPRREILSGKWDEISWTLEIVRLHALPDFYCVRQREIEVYVRFLEMDIRSWGNRLKFSYSISSQNHDGRLRGHIQTLEGRLLRLVIWTWTGFVCLALPPLLYAMFSLSFMYVFEGDTHSTIHLLVASYLDQIQPDNVSLSEEPESIH